MSITINTIFEADILKLLWVIKHSIFGKLPKCVRQHLVKLEGFIIGPSSYGPTSMLVTGKKYVGKSYFLINMINKLHDKYDNICVLTEKYRRQFLYGLYYNYKHRKIQFMYVDCDMEDHLKIIIEFQKQRIVDNVSSNILLVIDDCISYDKNKQEPFVDDLMKNYKNYNIDLLVAVQYSVQLNPSYHDKFTYKVIYKDNFRKKLALYHKIHFNKISKKTFINEYDTLYKYQALISIHGSDKIFKYTAPFVMY